MTTTNTLPTMNERGMPITTASRYRIERAVAHRNAGMTYEWIAQECGYRSPAVAAANITRYVAWLNGQTGQPAAPGADPLTRAFGVEIEFTGITRRVAAEAISTALGRMVSVHHYHGTLDALRSIPDDFVSLSSDGGDSGLNLGYTTPTGRGRLVVDASTPPLPSIRHRVRYLVDALACCGDETTMMVSASAATRIESGRFVACVMFAVG